MRGLLLILILNFLPIFFITQQNPDDARIIGIPIGYLFWLLWAGGIIFFFFLYDARSVLRVNIKIILFWSLFSLVLFMVNILMKNGYKFIPYVLSLAIYPILFIAIYERVRSFPFKQISKLLKKIVYCYVMFIIFASILYFIGKSETGNFFMFYNRNATTLSSIIVFSVVLSLYEKKEISSRLFFLLLIVWAIGLFTLESRAGLVSWFILLYSYYYFKNRLKGSLFVLLLLVLSLILLNFTPKNHLIQRISSTTELANNLLTSNQTLNAGDNDYRRYALIQAGLDIIKDNLWEGTGFSTAAYIDNFNENTYKTYAGLPHNLYLSYLAQMGIYLFILFLIGIRITFISLFKFPLGKALIITFMTYMLFNEYFLLPEFWIISPLILSFHHKYIIK